MKLTEGFEIDRNELETLQDKSLAPEALRVFYGAVLKLNSINKLDEVREVFDLAEKQLAELYKDSPFFAYDFYRVEGQLVQCFNQRVNQLKVVGELEPEPAALSAFEKQEYDSMRNKELRTTASKIYRRGKMKLRSAANNPKKLLAERQVIAAELRSVYQESGANDDLGKWLFMLDIEVKSISDDRTGMDAALN